MKKITYKQSEDRTIHSTVDSFLEHLERMREEQKKIQMQYLFGSMLGELAFASIDDKGNWSSGIDLKKYGMSISLPDKPTFVELDSTYLEAPSFINLDTLGPVVNRQFGSAFDTLSGKMGATYLKPTQDEITFNGSPMKDVISYDETTGEVHYYEIDWHSKSYITDNDDPTGYRTAKSKGQVQVVSKYKAPAPPPAESTDLNKEPYNGCGIDPNYAPWYNQSIPSFTETVQKVEFEFCGFEPVGIRGGTMMKKASCLDKLVIDGVDLGVGWSLVLANAFQGILGLCFVKLDLDPTGQIVVAEHSTLDTLQLRSKANIAPGYPHIYKIVTVPDACFSLHTPNALPPSDVLDPKTWMPGSTVEIRNNPRASAPDTGTITTMKRLC